MSIGFKDCTINGGVMNGAIFGQGNIVQNDYSNIENSCFTECLDKVIKYSDDKKEQECAMRAKELYAKDKKSLKDFIIDNLATFTTGTFASVSGGLLLSIIKNILKIA